MNNNIKFYPMNYEDFWKRPQQFQKGYTFRNGGGEGQLIFTLLEDYNPTKDIHGNIKVLCFNIITGYSHIETWNDCEYLSSSFKNGEYFPYWKRAKHLENYYI